jgi:DNA polymerase-1
LANTLRSCMVTEPGYTFISADASQIELRVLAILSQDQAMIADLVTGDLHLATAIRIYGFTENKDEMKLRRYKAKTGNFATVYGASAFQLASTFQCSEEEAEEFLAEHKRAYPRLYAWMAEVIAQARVDGYVTTMFGRIRPIPELVQEGIPWKIKEKAEKEVVNTKVQGTAVDIVKMMMMYMRRVLPREIRLVLNVHDEMVWECPDSLLSQALESHKELSQAFPDYPVTIKVGKIYGEIEEIHGE